MRSMKVQRGLRRNPGMASAILVGGLVLGAQTIGATRTPPARGMAFESASALKPDGCVGGHGFADVINHRDDFYRWPKTTISYTRMDSFNSAFGDPAFAHQLDLAFATWGEAFARPQGASAAYWSESNSTIPFWDFRSLVLHEIGHALGLDHPDGGQVYGFNFGLSAQGAPVQAIADKNWVMSTIDTGGGDQKKYNQILAWDDRDALGYTHKGIDLDFVPTLAAGLADIRIHAADFKQDHDLNDHCGNDVNDSTLGYAFISDSVPVNPADATKGRYLKRVDIWINSNLVNCAPIGIRTRMALWDVQMATVPAGSPTPLPIRAVQVQTRDANAPIPLEHFDNKKHPLVNPHQFRWFRTLAGDPAVLDRLFHTWTDPKSGAIPWNELIRVGLTQDVDNWWAEFLRVVDSTSTSVEVLVPSPPLAPVNVLETVVFAEVTPVAWRDGASRPAGAHAVLQPRPEPVAVGMTLSNPEYPNQRLRVTRLALADATAGGTMDAATLELEDLTPEMLAERFVLYDLPVATMGELADLDVGEAFHLFVDGDPEGLPSGFANYKFIADYFVDPVVESLRDRPLVVVVHGVSEMAAITTTTVLWVPPIVPANSALGPPGVYLPFLSHGWDPAAGQPTPMP